jgi:hypothetical protein
MATFYLLAARAVLGDHLADLLGALMPGVEWTVQVRRRMAELLLESLELSDEVFLVFRDELPRGTPVESALVEGYGAEPGDEVVEVRSGHPTRRWRISQAPNLAA